MRRATAADAAEVGRLMHDFESEFDEPSPGPEAIAKNAAPMLESGETTILLGGDGPDGLAEVRIRRSILTGRPDAYLEELYVAPAKRGRGLGRALLEAAIEAARDAGATRMDLGTSEDDVAARKLYESAGFDNHEGKPDGPVMHFYEKDPL